MVQGYSGPPGWPLRAVLQALQQPLLPDAWHVDPASKTSCTNSLVLLAAFVSRGSRAGHEQHMLLAPLPLVHACDFAA